MLNTSVVQRNAYVITGPTSGIGHMTALESATHGTVVLVGRTRAKLDEVATEIQARGVHAVSVVCDLSDLTSVRRAAAEIIALDLPLAGLVNNAGIAAARPFQTNQKADERPFGALRWRVLRPDQRRVRSWLRLEGPRAHRDRRG